MVNYPNAKINLGLYITAKRTDGFHEIASCFYPIKWEEALEIIPSKAFNFSASGIPVPGEISSNLIVKAYQLLQSKHNLPPVSIHLHKSLPMGAGLGGGSSDASHTLKLLNSIFDLNLSQETLLEYSAQLGSDCAFFIYNNPCIASGRGEILTPFSLSLKGYYLLLIHPGIHISTSEAYAGVTPRSLTIPLENILNQAPEFWKDKLINQFEEHLFKQLPELATIKKQLYDMGAAYASMSGSGSAMYGIFKEKPVDFMWPEHYKTKLIEL